MQIKKSEMISITIENNTKRLQNSFVCLYYKFVFKKGNLFQDLSKEIQNKDINY